MKTTKSFRLHIGIFGRVNVGKSSLVNALIGQEISIVSEIKGTTTDVVEKSMEFLPIGPITILDTAGLDDKSELGELRIQKAKKIINRTDVAIVVCDYEGFFNYEKELIGEFNALRIPFIAIVNKSDEKRIDDAKLNAIKEIASNIIVSSAKNDENIVNKIKSELIKILPESFITPPSIMGDLVKKGDVVILVVPIDKEAPKGRIILPQVQTLRDLLDNNCISMVVKTGELKNALEELKHPPKFVVTDSQAFKEVNEILPPDINLTSFSILFARLKGDLKIFFESVENIKNLKKNDKVLILESCSHHNIEDDIAKVKIPRLLQQKLGLNLNFEYFSGHDTPDLKGYELIIHCGACMTNRREMLSRIQIAKENNVPITNYGVVISYCLNILDRVYMPI